MTIPQLLDGLAERWKLIATLAAGFLVLIDARWQVIAMKRTLKKKVNTEPCDIRHANLEKMYAQSEEMHREVLQILTSQYELIISTIKNGGDKNASV